MYYVYLLQYNEQGKHYIGCTKSLQQRVREHKDSTGCQTTQNVDDPSRWNLIYYEAYAEKSDALRRERKLKQYGAARGHVYKRARDSMDA